MDALSRLAISRRRMVLRRVTSVRRNRTSPRCCTKWARPRWLSWRRRPCRRDPHQPGTGSAAADRRGGGDRRAAHVGGEERRRKIADRHGLSRHAHAAGDPAECAGEPRLVHRRHTLSGGNCARPAGGAAQLPDDDLRPDSDGDRQRLAAGRGHRGGRGDGDGTRHQQDEIGRGWRWRPTCIRRRAPCWQRARGRSGSRWRMSRQAI